MTKYNQQTQAEHMYIYDKKSLAEIGMQLGLSRRILFYWKKEYNWDKKRFKVEHNKDRFSEELLEFARKMMQKISTDIDKNQALSEAIRLAKTGGVIYASYCNNDTSMYKFFYTNRVLKYLEKGLIKEDYHTVSSPEEIFELYRKSDIDELMKKHNVTRLHFVGVDMLSYIFDDRFDLLTDREFEEYMKFLSNLCEREDCVGMSIHMLDIFRKK